MIYTNEIVSSVRSEVSVSLRGDDAVGHCHGNVILAGRKAEVEAVEQGLKDIAKTREDLRLARECHRQAEASASAWFARWKLADQKIVDLGREKQRAKDRGVDAWIQTYTGRKVYPFAPTVDMIDIRDIAHALARIGRFTGHTRDFYSVAQHCTLMVDEVPPQDRLWALLHDAAEAYLGDIAHPVKQAIPAFREAEDRLLAVIADRFGLPLTMPASVEEADGRMLVTESRDLLTKPLPAVEGGWKPYGWGIAPLSPEWAEKIFLKVFDELTGAAGVAR